MNSPFDSQIQHAQSLQRDGRLLDAEHAYRAILARSPTLPNCWYNLGVVQRLRGRPVEALESYAEALRHGVSRPEEVHLNRAAILADTLRREEEAEAELHTALRLNPQYEPALLNLASLQEGLGRLDAARALYGQALALNPMSFTAFARVTNLMPRGAHSPELIERMRGAIARPEAAAADRALLGFALGRALDGMGDYPGAFAAYEAANRDSRASSSPQASYDRAAQERIVNELIATPMPNPVRAIGPARPGPVFICGMYRSGSALTEQLLAGNPVVRAGGELPLLQRIIRRNLLPFPAAAAGASPAQLERLALGYRSEIATLFPGAAYVTDTRPDNFFCIGLIKTLFPDAQIVHTVRDPVDTCLSVFFQHLDHRLSYALDLADIGHFYRQYQRLMSHWRDRYGASIIDFDYDRLVKAPESTARGLFERLGLAWQPRYLDFPGGARTAQATGASLYQHASGRAQHYERELAAVRVELGLEAR